MQGLLGLQSEFTTSLGGIMGLYRLTFAVSIFILAGLTHLNLFLLCYLSDTLFVELLGDFSSFPAV